MDGAQSGRPDYALLGYEEKNRIALDTGGGTRGSRPRELVTRWAIDGGCRPTKSGVSADSEDKGKAAYKALLSGGSAGFDAVLGGGRSEDGQYEQLEAHGFYWTASEIDSAIWRFYNFGSGGKALHRQDGGITKNAFSVRCVRERRFKSVTHQQRSGERGWTRTIDPCLKRALLYQLSYAPIFCNRAVAEDAKACTAL